MTSCSATHRVDVDEVVVLRVVDGLEQSSDLTIRTTVHCQHERDAHRRDVRRRRGDVRSIVLGFDYNQTIPV